MIIFISNKLYIIIIYLKKNGGCFINFNKKFWDFQYFNLYENLKHLQRKFSNHYFFHTPLNFYLSFNVYY